MDSVDQMNVKIESRIWTQVERFSTKSRAISVPLLISLLALDIFTHTAKCFEALIFMLAIRETRKEQFIELVTNIFLYPLALMISFTKTLIVVYKFFAWKTIPAVRMF